MYNLNLSSALYPNGGEAYSYSQLRYWLINNLGVSPKQVAGVVGAGVRYGYLTVATYAERSFLGEAIFTR